MRIARNLLFALGGCFGYWKKNIKRSWPLISLSGFFRPKWGDLQKKKSSLKLKQFFRPKVGGLQKKVFTQIQSRLLTNFRWDPKKNQLCGPNHSEFFTNFDCQSYWGGLFSILKQKSASKALNTWCFAYFSGQWGARPPPWLRYCCNLILNIKF